MQEADDGLDRGGLAGAVGPDDAHDLAGVDVERDAVEDVDLAVAGGHPVGDEQLGARHQTASPMYSTCGYGNTSTMRGRRTRNPLASSAPASRAALPSGTRVRGASALASAH